MLGQARQGTPLIGGGQWQIGLHEAARDRMQLVASRFVGGRPGRFQQRRLEKLVQRQVGQVTSGRQERAALRRRREQRQGGQQIARSGRQAGNGRGKHLAEDLAFGTREPLADALHGLAAAQLTNGPAGQQGVARGGSKHLDGLHEGASHLWRALSLGFSQQQLAHSLGCEWLGHQRAHLAG